MSCRVYIKALLLLPFVAAQEKKRMIEKNIALQEDVIFISQALVDRGTIETRAQGDCCEPSELVRSKRLTNKHKENTMGLLCNNYIIYSMFLIFPACQVRVVTFCQSSFFASSFQPQSLMGTTGPEPRVPDRSGHHRPFPRAPDRTGHQTRTSCADKY